MMFFLERELKKKKKTLRGILMRAACVVWTLVDNGKLANRIARLAAIAIKIKFLAHDLFGTRIVCAKGWDLVIFDLFVLRTRMQVISFHPPWFSPYSGGKKGE